MQLAILIAVLAALAQTESAEALPVEGWVWRVGLVFAGMLLAPLVAACGSLSMTRAFAAGRFHRQCSYARYQFLQRLATGLWLLASGVVLYVLQWPAIVRVNWSLAEWPLVDELCILAPIVLPLGLLWLAFYQVENAAHRAVARQTGSSDRSLSAGSYLLLQARHHLGLALLPALAVIAGQELLAKYGPPWANDERAWWLCLPVAAGLLLALPLLLRNIWRTTSLPVGPLRERLEAVLHDQKCAVRDLLVWHTQGQIANALVAGFVPRFRLVFLTDGLLNRLTDAELAAVVRHEAGHIIRRHLPLRMLLLTLPLVALFALKAWQPQVVASVPLWLAELGIAPAWQASLLLPAIVVLYAVTVVGSYSRLLEHDADLEAIYNQAEGQPDEAACADFIAALTKVSGGVAESRLGQWLHPPLNRRIGLLRHVIRQPAAGYRFQRRLNHIAWLLTALYLLACAAALAG
jgi:Zn-dependent protease with chaperone function